MLLILNYAYSKCCIKRTRRKWSLKDGSYVQRRRFNCLQDLTTGLTNTIHSNWQRYIMCQQYYRRVVLYGMYHLYASSPSAATLWSKYTQQLVIKLLFYNWVLCQQDCYANGSLEIKITTSASESRFSISLCGIFYFPFVGTFVSLEPRRRDIQLLECHPKDTDNVG